MQFAITCKELHSIADICRNVIPGAFLNSFHDTVKLNQSTSTIYLCSSNSIHHFTGSVFYVLFFFLLMSNLGEIIFCFTQFLFL
jgi:hypothetical protein